MWLCGDVLWLVEVWPLIRPLGRTQEISKCRQLVVLPVLLGDVFHSGWGLVGTPDTNKFCLVRGPPFVSGLGVILCVGPDCAGGFTEVTVVVLGALG